MKAYGADKDFNSGLESMAQAVQDDSLTKAHGQMSGMKKARKEGLINEDGSLSDPGKEAFALQSNEAISALVGKGNIGKNIDKALDAIYKQAYEQAYTDTNDVIASQEAAEERIKPFLKDGKVNYRGDGSLNTDNALEGLDFWNKNAELKAGSFSGSNSIVLGGGATFSGSLGQDGEVHGNISGGLSSKTNNSISNDSSKSKKTGEYLETGIEMQVAEEIAKGILNGRYGKGNYSQETLKNTQESIKNNTDLANHLRSKGIDLLTASGAEVTKEALKYFGAGDDSSIGEILTTGMTGAALAGSGYYAYKKMFGGAWNNGRSPSSASPSQNSMPNQANNVNGNINDPAQSQASQNSSHRNPPNKFVSDGRGGVIPNPEYEAHQRNRPILTKISDAVKGGVRSVWNSVKSGRISAVSLASSLALQHTEAGTILDRADTLNYAAIGGTVGSVVPVVGTAIGAGIGGAIGFAKDVYDGDVKAVWNWARGNTPATNENISSKANAYTVQGSVHNVFANNAQESISYNSKEQASYSRDMLDALEASNMNMEQLSDYIVNMNKR
ncbi:hypothetical protein [Aliarcobacter thereius]|uniref:hypothetical protein n=1 Tax=Aliarcobacter thereius TaxID=544718 RepID=UPI0008261E84|nr:hypothetical protein [Aliarcobacter thereius]OCL91284.1 hypothetical protein AAX25_01454 [Aliarcobacter thereius]